MPAISTILMLGLRHAELDCYAWYRSLTGRVASAGPRSSKNTGIATHETILSS